MQEVSGLGRAARDEQLPCVEEHRAVPAGQHDLKDKL